MVLEISSTIKPVTISTTTMDRLSLKVVNEEIKDVKQIFLEAKTVESEILQGKRVCQDCRCYTNNKPGKWLLFLDTSFLGEPFRIYKAGYISYK